MSQYLTFKAHAIKVNRSTGFLRAIVQDTQARRSLKHFFPNNYSKTNGVLLGYQFK
jgi:hypothetical protein